ncbi:MAG: hypothetical protein QF755_03580 [Candidatus Peribacteraceae bacterium]|jgi:hypothetical protein|nr:hypothetical protein [Candidatus Peribacteraceae bacterium]|tara:strand:- start:201 stop:377 length:177 start_codon:yes stop_codon:yes gene_type:complete
MKWNASKTELTVLATRKLRLRLPLQNLEKDVDVEASLAGNNFERPQQSDYMIAADFPN